MWIEDVIVHFNNGKLRVVDDRGGSGRIISKWIPKESGALEWDAEEDESPLFPIWNKVGGVAITVTKMIRETDPDGKETKES